MVMHTVLLPDIDRSNQYQRDRDLPPLTLVLIEWPNCGPILILIGNTYCHNWLILVPCIIQALYKTCSIGLPVFHSFET
uniref:Uncharacterized protein n=1 Tax=Arundo donax TaxID=35708 RepID=A0A0A8ZUB1_ARUDO